MQGLWSRTRAKTYVGVKNEGLPQIGEGVLMLTV